VPELYFEPTTLSELRDILKQAHDNKKKIRVMGLGNSPSNCAYSKDYVICMKNFDKVLEVKNFIMYFLVEFYSLKNATTID
jgi:hypothetical protein